MLLDEAMINPKVLSQGINTFVLSARVGTQSVNIVCEHIDAFVIYVFTIWRQKQGLRPGKRFILSCDFVLNWHMIALIYQLGPYRSFVNFIIFKNAPIIFDKIYCFDPRIYGCTCFFKGSLLNTYICHIEMINFVRHLFPES